jgi:hypothetical protein
MVTKSLFLTCVGTSFCDVAIGGVAMILLSFMGNCCMVHSFQSKRLHRGRGITGTQAALLVQGLFFL